MIYCTKCQNAEAKSHLTYECFCEICSVEVALSLLSVCDISDDILSKVIETYKNNLMQAPIEGDVLH